MLYYPQQIPNKWQILAIILQHHLRKLPPLREFSSQSSLEIAACTKIFVNFALTIV